MRHQESDLQIRCIKWFRYQYPAYARLMEHPHNEGNGLNRRQQSIANAEGVTKGVADLILHVPADNYRFDTFNVQSFTSLAVEMKTPKGSQSKEQKEWQRFFVAAGGMYIVIRSYDDFVSEVTKYIDGVSQSTDAAIKKVYSELQHEADEAAKEQFRKLINK